MSRKPEDREIIRREFNELQRDIGSMMYNRGMSRILCEQAKKRFAVIIKYFEEDVEAGMAVTG